MRNKRFVVVKPPICFENYRRRYVEMCYANITYDENVNEVTDDEMNYDEYSNDGDDISLEYIEPL